MGTFQFKNKVQIAVSFAFDTLKHVRFSFGFYLLTLCFSGYFNEIACIFQRFLQLAHGLSLRRRFGQVLKTEQGLHGHCPLTLQNIAIQTQLQSALAMRMLRQSRHRKKEAKGNGKEAINAIHKFKFVRE